MADRCRYQKDDLIVTTGKQDKLLDDYGEPIIERIGPEPVNLVRTASEQLQTTDSSQSDIHGDKSAMFLAQRQLREDAAEFVSDRRKAIARAFPKDKAIRRDFGIGKSMNVTSPNTIHKALTSFITAGEAAPDKLAKAGITTGELDKMKDYASRIVSGRKLQAGSVAAAKSATVARNLLQLKVEDAVLKVVTTAALVYRDTKPEVVELFEETLPKARGGSRKKKKPATTPTPPEEGANGPPGSSAE